MNSAQARPLYYCSPRLSGQSTREWLERINALYEKVKEAPLPCIDEAKRTLFDAGESTARRERILLALINHPDQGATDLLEHPALILHHPRLAFTRHLARRRRQRRLAGGQRRAA